MPGRTCKYCGRTNLGWKSYGGNRGRFLNPDGSDHVCDEYKTRRDTNRLVIKSTDPMHPSEWQHFKLDVEDRLESIEIRLRRIEGKLGLRSDSYEASKTVKEAELKKPEASRVPPKLSAYERASILPEEVDDE